MSVQSIPPNNIIEFDGFTILKKGHEMTNSDLMEAYNFLLAEAFRYRKDFNSLTWLYQRDVKILETHLTNEKLEVQRLLLEIKRITRREEE
jgi:hypothetical protein